MSAEMTRNVRFYLQNVGTVGESWPLQPVLPVLIFSDIQFTTLQCILRMIDKVMERVVNTWW